MACRATLALRCAECRAELPSGARFCDSCGTPVAVQLMVEREAAAIRKTVTVLFSDLTGSTSLGERLDPESVRSMMTPVYAAMRSEVESRGGYVAKFVGDGVMAIFGIPEVHEDDAVRAVDAAVGMRQSIDRLSADMPAALALKVGINTGEIVTGTGDEDVVGDCVNVASRLEGAAAPGEILVGEETWRLTRSDATYEPVAPLTLKGKSQPVPAHRLVSLERTQEAGSTTFVGRDDELERLRKVFDEVVESGASRLVAIVGSPGLGKTRLARELGVALTDRALVVETRCDAAGTATYAPVTDALRAAAGIDEAAEPDAVLEAITALIPEDDADRDRIAQRVAALFGAGAPGSTEETFWAIRRMIENAARAMPMVLVLDDLHWGEPLLLDLVEHLAQWMRTAPVLLVVTGRPELREIRPSLTERDHCISLEGLDGYATEQLARGLLGSDRVPAELLARLPASTEGNPLFVREFVRMLVDDGVLRRADGEWIATINVDAIEVPPTIQSLLAARVDRLTPQERTVLELASVVGKEFYRGAIDALAPAGVRVGLDAHLESLRRKELVEPAGTYWIDEPVFRFHHALIQDAAYRRLLKESRAELHERVATWLERKTQGLLGEHDELIGYHLEQAHESRRQLGPLDDHARSLGERAARLLASAARSALDRDDLPAAASLSGRALDRLEPEHSERAEILLVRCEALLATGDVTAAAPAVTELAAGASSPRLWAWATCFSGELANLTDPARLRETEKHVLVAAAELAELGDAAGAAKAHTVRATALAGLGRVAECEGALDDALTAAREAGDRRRVTDVLGRAPTAALWGPSPVSRAGGRCLDIVRLLRITTGSPAVEATSLRCQAVLEAFRGRADAARRMLRKARRDLEELGLSHGIHETEMFAGIVELAAGDPAGAEPHLRSAHEGLLAMRVDVHAARAAALLARAHLAMGEEDEAERFADESERLGGDDLKTAIAWRAVWAQILARRGRIDEARGLAESAVEIASRTDALIDHGDACVALAAVCSAAGDAAGARRASEQAASLYERKGATALLETIRSVEAPAAQAAPASTPADGPVNECVLVGRRFAATFEKRDWTSCASLLAPDVCIDDRRAVISYGLIEGREAALEIVKSMAEVGTVRCELTPIAIRGRSLVLGRVDLSGPVVGSTSFGAQILQVGEIDEAGLLRRMVNFDPDDFDAAIAELDERYAAGEGAEFAKFVAISSRFLRAINEADESAFRELCSEDIVQIDHRPASLGEMRGLTAVAESVTALQELAPGLRILAQRFVALRADASVATFLVTGKTPDGADFEQVFSAVAVLRAGLLSRIERFPADDLDAALSRFNELDVEGRDALSTPCTRAIEEHLESFLHRDWAALGALLADDVLWVDKRAGLQNEVRGRAATVESYRAIAEVGVTKIERGVVATRGHKLSLSREVFGAEGVPYEAEMLALNQIDDDGRIVYRAVFEPADFDTAIEELDERFIAGEGAEFAAGVALVTGFLHAFSRRDTDTYARLIAEDVVQIDHRPASLGEMHSRDEFMEAADALMELLAVVHTYARTFEALRSDACVMSLVASGKTADGAEIEQAYYVVGVTRGGQVTRIERFAPDDLEVALARFHELREPSPTVGPAENECWRVFTNLAHLFEARDWKSFEAGLAADILFQDHRTLTGTRDVGASAMTLTAKTVADQGILRPEQSLVATRGERLALMRVFLRGRDLGSAAFETELLTVFEIDGQGRAVAWVIFGPDDFDAALAELDERYAGGEGATHLDDFSAISRLTRSYSTADWSAFRSLLADDVAFVDNRPASLGRIDDTDDFVRAIRELKELVPDLVMYVSAIRRIEPGALVVEVVTSGTTPEGALVELVFFGVVEIRDALISRIEIFPPDQQDAALSRFDELGHAGMGRLENACVRAFLDVVRTFEQRDWDRLAECYTPDTVFDDRRKGLRDREIGRDARLRIWQGIAEVGVAQVSLEPLAIRGERLALGRAVFSADDASAGFETEVLIVYEIDDDDRTCSSASFDVDDLDAAFAELDERYASGEAIGSEVAPAVADLLAAMNVRDWSKLRSILSDSLTVVDHRPASLGELGPDEWIESYKVLVDLLPDVRADAKAYRAIEGDRAVTENQLWSLSEGALVENRLFHLYHVANGEFVHFEFFPIDRFDLALTRFEELGRSALSASAPLENAAVRAQAVYAEAVLAADWDAYMRVVSEDSVWDDRRSGLQSVLRGRDARLEHARATSAIGVRRGISTPLAIRGDRLLLSGVVLTSDEEVSFEAELLMLTEVDAAGRICASVAFGAEDVDAAFAELDERYAAGEGAPYAETLKFRKFIAAYNARDWDGMRAAATSDFHVIDHRPASFGRADNVDEMIRIFRALIDLVPDIRIDPSVIHAINHDTMLASLRVWGTSTEGAEIELSNATISRVRDGLVSHAEIFPSDQLDKALARFEQLTTTGAETRHNTCSRAFEKVLRVFEQRRWDDLGELYSEGFVVEDLRPGLGNAAQGRAGSIEGWQAAAGVGALRANSSVLATRGERLALTRVRFGGEDDSPDAFGSEIVFLNEIDANGRISFALLHDAEDIDNAFEELDKRFIAGEGRGVRGAEMGIAYLDAFNAHDFARVRELFADDLMLIDHRPASLGELGPDEFIDAMTELARLIQNGHAYGIALRRTASDGFLASVLIRGTTTEDTPVEMAFHQLGLVRGDKLTRIETFPIEDLSGSLARFEELRESGTSVPVSVENAALRVLRLANDLMERGDWEAFAELHAVNVQMVDGRRGLQSEVTGRQQMVDFNRTTAEVARYRVDITPIAVRGDQLALARLVVTPPTGKDGFEVELLTLSELDADSRVIYSRAFDVDDLDAAFTEIDDRYIAGEGAPVADMIRVTGRVPRAVIAQDWPAFRDVLTEDFVLADHRPASMGELSSDEWIESWKAFSDLVPDLRTRVAAYHAVAPDRCVAEVVSGGTSREGGAVETVISAVIQLRGNRVCRLEAFPVDRREDAIARFEELRTSRPAAEPVLENRCTQTVARVIEGFEQRDWEIVADCHSDDTVEDDRRTGFKTLLRGRDEVVGNIRAIADVGTHRIDHTVVATRGDRLALFRFLFRGRDEAPATFGIEALLVFEIDIIGRVSVMVMFDPDDLDAAFAELDDRYLAGEGSAFPYLRAGIDYIAAYNLRDWDRLRGTATDDFVWVDHRPASSGRIEGIDALIELYRTMLDLVPNIRFRVTQIYAIDEGGCAFSLMASGTTPDGAEVELGNEAVVLFREGRISCSEILPAGDVEAAMARFEDLRRPEGPARDLENLASRSVTRRTGALVRQDWDALVSTMSPNVRFEDRQAGLRTIVEGIDGQLDQARAVVSLGLDAVDNRTVATRGDRLALVQEVFHVKSLEFEIHALSLVEVGEDGRGLANIMFDPSDLDGAFAELDARHLASPDATALDRLGAEFVSAFNDRDWERMRLRLITEDFVYVDHQPAGVGTLEGADAYVRSVSTLLEMLPEYRVRLVGSYLQDEQGTVCRLWERGVDPNDNVVEFEYASVVMMRAGRLVRAENYAIEELDAALARFEELTSTDTTHGLENDCTRLLRRAIRLYRRRDWDALAECLAEHGVSEDRRVGLRHEYVGRDVRIESLRVGADLGAARLSFVPIATRGQRLALCRYRREGPSDGGFETGTLELDELDESGRHKGTVMFDPDDLDAAFAELEERYLAGEGSAYSHVWGVFVSLAEAYGRDWEMYASLLTDDLVFVDHRPASLGRIDGPQELVRSQKALIELVPDMKWRVESIEALERDAFAVRMHAPGTSAEGVQVEFDLYFVGKVRDGRLALLEFFPVDQRDAALARFEELVASAAPTLSIENAATAAMRRGWEHALRGEWDVFRTLVSLEFRFEDRRAGLQHVAVGLEENIRALEAIRSVGTRELDITPLATRGERVALCSMVFRGREYEVELLELMEFNEQGLAVLAINFDPEDRVAAFAELDERYGAELGPAYADFVRILSDLPATHARRDWDAYSSLHDPELVAIDHRPASLGQIVGGREWASTHRALLDLIPDLRVQIVEIYEVEPWGAAYGVRFTGTNLDGGLVEHAMNQVATIDDSRITRLEVFPIEARDEMLNRFEELRSERQAASL